MELELQTDQISRRLSVVYYDATELLNRTHIKRWLAELEKNVTKSFPDFIILKGCCRYISFELQRKEWCKYYFLSNQYAPNQPVVRSHLVLSRYPLVRNDTFASGESNTAINGTVGGSVSGVGGAGVNHLVEVRIPFNDLPMRYEYEDLDVQQIDNETINILIVDYLNESNESPTNPNASDIPQGLEVVLQNLTRRNNPPTIILAGLPERSISVLQHGFTSVEGGGLCYLSEAWALTEQTDRTQTYEFDLLNFD